MKGIEILGIFENVRISVIPLRGFIISVQREKARTDSSLG